MRFRGTLILLLICAALGGYLYFYEIKGGEQRAKAKQEENRLWKLESGDIQQLDLTFAGEHITATRIGDKDWKIAAPRSLEADSEEIERLASSGATLNRETTVETGATDLARFGLDPAPLTLELKAKDGKTYKVLFGTNNPTGSSTYATLPEKKDVFLVAKSAADAFNKKLDELRNRSVLKFEQNETQSLDLKSAKGEASLVLDNDRWWIQGKERWAADASMVNGILSSLSSERIKEFFENDAGGYANLGFDKPLMDLRLTYGKNKAIKRLIVGTEKSRLVKKGENKPPLETMAGSEEAYLAKDESREDLFFLSKDVLEKFIKSPSELRDRALAAFQRWDIDAMILTNAKGTFSLSKEGGGWYLGEAKKRTDWETANGLLDALEKPVKEFLDSPSAAAVYGLDKPPIRLVLKQGSEVKVECILGKETKDGVYAQVKGESAVKIAEREVLTKLSVGESDLLEKTPPPEGSAPAQK